MTSPYKWIAQAEEKHQWTYPISATINGEPVIVWEDWIEHLEPDPYEPDHEPWDDDD